jgi:hypothetical protein
VSYSVTVLLAIVFFLGSVSTTMPRSSNPMSILGYFLLFQFVLSTLICFFSILVVRLLHNDDFKQPVPPWLRVFIATISGRKYARPGKVSNMVSVVPVADIDTTEPVKSQDPMGKQDADHKEHVVGELCSWDDVSKLMDTIFGVFSAICWTFGVTTFLVILTSNR